MTKLADATEE